MPTHSPLKPRSRRAYINLEALMWAETVLPLPMGPKSLLLFLARKADVYGCSYYKKGALAANLGCSSRSVQSHLRVLETHGLVRVIGRCATQMQISNVYHVIGWTARKHLPRQGHPNLGRFIKEPSQASFREALLKQNLLQQAEKSALHNNNTEILTALAEEDALENSIAALGTWINAREKELLREDHLSLLDLIEQGYGLEAHILPVLRKKANARSKVRLIRSWHYFSDAIAEYAEEAGEEIEKAFQTKSRSRPVAVDPEEAKANAFLQQLWDNLANKSLADGKGGTE